VNTITQGSAADLVKTAMINIHRRLVDRWPTLPFPTTRSTPTDPQPPPPRMLLQIHDELVLEVPETEMAEVATIVCQEMENAVKLKGVPLPVSISYGKKWGSLQPYYSLLNK